MLKGGGRGGMAWLVITGAERWCVLSFERDGTSLVGNWLVIAGAERWCVEGRPGW